MTDLLEKMGYGIGSVTPASNDAGIDGIIKTDPLGFNPILIKAKRYAIGHVVENRRCRALQEHWEQLHEVLLLRLQTFHPGQSILPRLIHIRILF